MSDTLEDVLRRQHLQAEGYSPYREVVRYRGLFRWSLALNLVLLVLLMRGCR